VSGGVVALVCVACVIGGLAMGCVGGYALGSTPTTSPTAVAASQTPSSEPPDTPSASASPAVSKTPSAKSSAPPSPITKIRVPNVIGENHQEAQDTMQRAGLYGLAEKDATGQGRALVWDRNWQVVRQHPKPGTRVAPDQTITLYAKKIGE
jgi:hypothetical protein